MEGQTSSESTSRPRLAVPNACFTVSPFTTVWQTPNRLFWEPSNLCDRLHYFQSIIYAHRPWMSKHVLQPQPPRGPGYRHARKMCVDSAIAVCKILVIYEQQHGIRFVHHSVVHVTSSAALLLLFADVCSLPEWKKQDVRECLSTCFRALGEISSSWQSAREAISGLSEMQQRWQARCTMASSNRRSRQRASTGLDNASGRREDNVDMGSIESSTSPQQNNAFRDCFSLDLETEWFLMSDQLASSLPNTDFWNTGAFEGSEGLL